MVALEWVVHLKKVVQVHLMQVVQALKGGPVAQTGEALVVWVLGQKECQVKEVLSQRMAAREAVPLAH